MRNNIFQDGVSNIGAHVVEWGLNTVGGVGRQYLPSPTPPTPPSSYKLADVKTADKPLLFFPKIIAKNWRCGLSTTKLRMFHARSCCNAKIYGKTVLNEEIPVNKYQKKINHMSKLVETIFILLKW